MEERKPAKGIGYILIAWLLFTVMMIFTRAAAKMASLPTILLFQNLIGVVSVIPWTIRHGIGYVKTERFGLILFRSVVSLMAYWMSFMAVQKISLLDTMLFSNSSPLWIPFVLLLWLKTPLKHVLWPGLVGGFLGIVLILKPGVDVINPGTLFALGAGVLQAVNMISLRQLSHTDRNHTVLFYYFVICSIVCLPLSLLTWNSLSFTVWIDVLIVGILFTLFQWTFVRAFHHAKASLLGPFCYSAVVYSVFIDWSLYGQIPDLLSWIGMGLVCAGGIWAIKKGQ
jgi:drug/metabolite transporter (DMT)-like permease